MDQDQLRALFAQVRAGELDIEGAVTRLRHMPFEDLGFAKIDHHRALRHGMPEVIFAKGKTPDQIVGIAERVLEHSPNLLITRTTSETGPYAIEKLGMGEYLPLSGIVRVWRDRTRR